MAPGTQVVFVGVRHHSPACARLVARTIEELRPAYVLVEGPADMNARLDELLLGHRLPVAVFSHYRDETRIATSWAPLCAYSPEWIALREGRAAGAEVRFIDLPAWHPAFADRPERHANRYADAEARYAEATRRLCEHFAVDSTDALWDQLFEVTEPGETADLRARLDAYFELVRGDAEADPGDRAREEYMASWVRAAAAHAGERPVLVVTGGFHQPALRGLVSGSGRGRTGRAANTPSEELPLGPPASPPGGRPEETSGSAADGESERALGSTASEPPDGPSDSAADGPTEVPSGSPPDGLAPSGSLGNGSTEAPSGSPIDGPAEAPSGSPADGPSDEAAGSPAERPTEEPSGSPGNGPTERSSGSPAGEPSDEAADLSAVEPSDEAADLPADGPSDLPADGSAHEPAGPPPGWPDVPVPPEGALGGSFLVPYSFRQLDAFAGYQSGMPSPGYYQHLWEEGPRAAAQGLTRSVAERLRARGIAVSTADLIAAHGLAQGLARLRGHPYETRVDVLDGLAAALIGDDLDQPLPWTTRSTLAAGTHPVVVEMVAACTGEAEGRLHPDTPLPPLVHDVTEQLARLRLTGTEKPVTLDLTDPRDLTRSQVLHRLRVLGIPGFTRLTGPADGTDPVFTERWEPRPAAGREAALIEAGAYGARLDEAAATLLGERVRAAGTEVGLLAELLFDAVLCGVGPLCDDLLGTLAAQVGQVGELESLGEVLTAALGLWRHDRVFGVARGPLLGSVVGHAADRVFWLVEGLHGGGGGVDRARLRALAAARDALLHAAELMSVTREAATEAATRISDDPRAPADLRGAAFGLRWSLHAPADPAAAVRSLASASPDALGDWLTGLFALAREEVAHGAVPGEESLIDVVDGVVSALSEDDFLTGLPALRQAFVFFPPRERERIAERLLERRGLHGSTRSLLRTTADPLLLARARALEENVNRLLERHGLGATR